jgi:hypothetical protein
MTILLIIKIDKNVAKINLKKSIIYKKSSLELINESELVNLVLNDLMIIG